MWQSVSQAIYGKIFISPTFAGQHAVSACLCDCCLYLSVSVPVRQRIQMTGDENGAGGRVRFLAYWLVVIGVFFNFGFEGRDGL